MRSPLLIVPLLIVSCATIVRAQDSLSWQIVRADSIEAARDSVIRAAEQALALDPRQMDEYRKIAEVHKARKRFKEELAVAERAVSVNPYSAIANFLLGDAFLDNLRPDTAIVHLKRALWMEPSFVRARTTLAEAYSMRKMSDSALLQLDTAVEQNPRFAQAWVQRANVLQTLGRDSAAIENLEQACLLVTDSYSLWMRLGRLQLHRGAYGDAAGAFAYARTLRPDDPDPLYLLGEAREKEGNWSEAVEAYEAFMLAFPTDKRALDAERAAIELRPRTRE